ncbi:MAG: hypothetical protein ACHBNF_17330 [Chromatiales bacterium]
MKANRMHLPALLGLFALTGQALANPEVGADYSSTTSRVTITSSSTITPTILRTVTVVCPVTGFTIAHADTQFGLVFSGSEGVVGYGISRNSTAFDENHHHALEGEAADSFESNPGAISRFDTCSAGQSVTYRFVAYLSRGLTTSTFAWQPKLSVVHYRDRY